MKQAQPNVTKVAIGLRRAFGPRTTSWLFRAELYFTYLGFSKKDWLPLPSFYLDGDALAWFDFLFRTKQFNDWNHFKEKFLLHFQQLSFADLPRNSNFYEIESTSGPANKTEQAIAVMSTGVFPNTRAARSSVTASNSQIYPSSSLGLFTSLPIPDIHDPNSCLTGEDKCAPAEDKVFDEFPQSDDSNLPCHCANDEALFPILVRHDHLVPVGIHPFTLFVGLFVESETLSDATTLTSRIQSELESKRVREDQVFAKNPQRNTDEPIQYAPLIMDPFASLVPGDKFSFGQTLVVPVSVTLNDEHMLDTYYCFQTRDCTSLFYVSESTIWTMPFCSCIDDWFNTGQYFKTDSCVFFSVESDDLNQNEEFSKTNIITTNKDKLGVRQSEGSFLPLGFNFEPTLKEVFKNILWFHRESNVHLYYWCDTRQESNLPGFLMSKFKVRARERKIQQVLRVFAESYFKRSPHIWVAKVVGLLFALFGIILKVGLFEVQGLLAKDNNGILVLFYTLFHLEPAGKLEFGLPMMQLKELFNLYNFLVNRENPHIASLLQIQEFNRAYGGTFISDCVDDFFIDNKIFGGECSTYTVLVSNLENKINKSKKQQKVLEFEHTIQSICVILSMDFFSTVTAVRSSLNESTSVQSQSLFTNTSSLGFTFILTTSFPKEVPHEEVYLWTMVVQLNLCTLVDDMEQLEADFKSVHFKVNWEHLHYIFFSTLIYFVDSSARIVQLDKWVASWRRLKGSVEMPKHTHVPWEVKSDWQDGKYDDSAKFKYFKGGYYDAEAALQFNFSQSFVLPMLSWSVVEYGTNFEVAMKLNHVNDIIIVVSILLFIPVLLWPMDLSEETQEFYHHSHVRCEVNFINTLISLNLTEFMLLWRFATRIVALVLSFSLLLIDSKRWQARAYEYVWQVKLTSPLLSTKSHNDQSFGWIITGALAHIFWSSHKACLGFEIRDWELASIIILDSNLEEKVLIEDGSIVMNQAQSNVTKVAIGLRRAFGPRTSNRVRLI
ncbi:triacylglycerol lipase sdp1 [Nicotiana attenuata]|uniref:cellulase n=1 Tax=Nicotiana attenuata TaxID=49451 RepID=A0A1J6I2H6_NICAT|nr:triacylglycerol lipase sdp1 [Nicotiana attenuata]